MTPKERESQRRKERWLVVGKDVLNRRRIAYANDPQRRDRVRKRALEKYYENPEVHKENSKRWRKSNPEATYKAKIKRHFGLEWDDYLKLVEWQDNKCAICKREQLGIRLSVDHCHETGVVRGLLCIKCNRGIGLLDDSIELLKAAIEYIEAVK